jgi:predicted DNA-binding transcriptional regulator AlpA
MISTPVKDILVKLLRDYANNIESGNSNITADEATNILSNITHVAMTKPEVCDYLNIGRARFDELVASGKLPRGKKLKHKTNLIWYKDEIIIGSSKK